MNLKLLRESLPHNYSETIAERTGYSQSMVRMVIKGFRKNQKIIEVAIAYAEEYRAKQIELQEKIEAFQV